jgi:hypothetical protein
MQADGGRTAKRTRPVAEALERSMAEGNAIGALASYHLSRQTDCRCKVDQVHRADTAPNRFLSA